MFRTLLSGTARRRRTRRPATRLLIQTLEAREVPAAFTPGNLVVYRVGDGSALTAGAATAVFLDEYTTGGTLVQSVPLPTTDNGANQTLTASATLSASEGYLNRSADGAYLVLTGYDAAVGTLGVGNSASATVARTIGRVAPQGSVDTSTTTTSFDGSSIRSAASADGSGFWVVGNTSGVVHLALGESGLGATVNGTPLDKYRTIGIAGGQLFVTNSTTVPDINGVDTVGTGLPTTGPAPLARLPGLVTTDLTSPYVFFFADLSANVAGPDTLYVADDKAGALTKFSLVGGNWTSNGTVGVDADDYRGVTGIVSGTTVTLFATRKATTAGEMVSLTDASGYNGAFAGTPTVIVPTTANKIMRGVALVPNHAPAVTDGTLTTDEDSATDGTLGGTDADSNPLTFSVVSPPAHGAVQITNVATGAYTYTPAGDYNGPDSFTFRATDGGDVSNTATVTVTVNSVNDAPVNTIQPTYSTNEDVGVSLQGIAVADADAGAADVKVTFSVTAGTVIVFDTVPNGVTADTSGNGTSSVTVTAPLDKINTTLFNLGAGGSGIAYFPPADFNGDVTLTMVTDDQGNTGGPTQTATTDSTITVRAVNDPPVNVGPTAPVVAPAVEDTAFPFAGDFSFFINDPDAGAGTLSTTLTATHGTLTVTPAANVTITGNGTTEVALSGPLDDLNAALAGLTFAPDADYFGPANFHVVTSDNGNTGGTAKTDTDDFAINVAAVNDPPVTVGDTPSTRQDTALTGTISATDAENDTLTFHVVTPPAHGILDLIAATGAYTYTPAAGYFGPDSFTFVANDGTADSNEATVSITIRANQAPVAQDGTLTAVEDVPSDGTLSATDADGDPLIFTVVTPPAHGTVQITGPATGAYTYTPAGDYNGPDSFTFKVNDGTVDSNTATVSVTVTAVNDAPVASDGSLTTAEDSAKGGTLSATDADGDGLTYAVATPPTHGTVQITDAATGAFTYTPAADYNGADSFTFKANDGTTDGTAATVSVTVTPVNDAPVFVAPGSAFTLALDTPNGTAVGAPLTATDVDGDAVTFALTGDTSGGGFQIDAATGQLSVRDTTLVTGGSYTLAVEVRDPSNATDSGTVTVVTNLRPVLDTAGTPMLLNQPLPVGKTPYTFAGTAVAGLLGFASDPDAGALRGIAITGVDAVNGTWEFNTEFGSPSASWQPITNVSDANALLLAADADTRVRFRPNPGFKPTFLGLSFKAWDQSDGAAEGPPLADTRDVRPGSPFSAATDTAWVAIGKVAPVVDPDGATVLPVPLPVYKATSKVVPLKVVKAQDLLGIAGLEVGETVATLKKASHGVAITWADRADGTWQYSATGKATDWHEVPADVSATNALLLGPTYKLRFAPTDRTADGAAPLTFLAWSPAADATLHAGDTNVDTTTHAAAFGADAGTAVLDLVPRLDLSKPAILNPVDAGDPTNAVALADLLDPFRVVGDNVGAAVVGATGPGTWHYSTDGGTTWPAFPVKPAVSVGQAVLLPLDALVRFEAANDTAGKKPLAPATAKLSVKAWDMTVASAGQRVAARGPAFSTETEVVTAAFRNTPPTLAPATPTLKPVSASAKPGTGFAVSTLLAGGVYSDADRPATPRGVAVTALTGTGGKWQYSLGGNVWVDFGAVDDTTAVLLAAGNRIRFLVTDPAAAVAGSPATLSFRAWDQSAGRAGDIGVDTTLAGGLTSFSATADTTTLEVVA